jgi:hypothetical protein
LRRFWRWTRCAIVAIALVFAVAASPVLYVETQCRVKNPPPTQASAFVTDDPAYQAAEGDSYLTYPEWYIVHVYRDLAAVTRQRSESSFDYLSSISGYWRSLCANTEVAETHGPASFDQRATDYVIGVSFSLEMAVIGGWERSIGALSVWARGPTRTPEDAFALKVADDFAAFLDQTPWYQYPFTSTLKTFWRETPFGEGSLVRSLERRVALTLEYGGKALYAVPIGAMAGADPAERTIKSVIQGLDESDIAADSRIHKVKDVGASAVLIETPRYQTLTDILVALAHRGRQVLEIAGSRHILVTIVGPEALPPPQGGRLLFGLPIQSAPGQKRFGLDVDVTDLSGFILATENAGAKFEHVYDP